MNPILLARHVQESLRELVHTTLNSSSRAFEGMVDRFLEEPANFIKGPWVSVDMPFRQIDGAADGTWAQPFAEVPLRFAPYQQMRIGNQTGSRVAAQLSRMASCCSPDGFVLMRDPWHTF